MFVLLCDVEFAQETTNPEYFVSAGSMAILGRAWLSFFG